MAGAIKRKNENGGARHALDKFYTKDSVALACINSIQELIKKSDVVIEPSAGAGAFSRQINHPNLLSYDLEPESPEIIKSNWFDISRKDIGLGKALIIGNPPFGVRSDLAKKFIQHSVSLGAETIAFVLPKTFSKAINQQDNLFPKDYRLIIEENLADESFEIDGESFHVPCRWYVWSKNDDFLGEIDLRKKLLEQSPDFSFMPRGSEKADFAINGNNGKVKRIAEISNPKAEHYIRVSNRNKLKEVQEIFKTLKFDFNSSVNGGVAWIGKQEILAAYYAAQSKVK